MKLVNIVHGRNSTWAKMNEDQIQSAISSGWKLVELAYFDSTPTIQLVKGV